MPESFFSKVCNFIKKETLAKVFSCEFCEISTNTFSPRTPPVAASKAFTNKFGIQWKDQKSSYLVRQSLSFAFFCKLVSRRLKLC